jgi:hypothetical protein
MKDIDTHSLFFPSQHITDPKWFAGRKNDIENALTSLCTPGGSMIIFGERGTGKTSFMEMIKLLAAGESHHLLYKYNFQKKFPPNKLKYKIASFTCNDGSKTTAKVLQNLITNPNGLKKFIPTKKEYEELTDKVKVGLGGLLSFLSLGGEIESKTKLREFQEEDIFELFTNLVETISSQILSKDEGLLIVVDEFDLVEDTKKMASLIKTLSKDNVKFLLCGIADSYTSLIEGHASISRQIIYGRIHIKLMSEDEIREVFELVSENTNKKIRFDPSFYKEVANKSNGFPYFVQLFGKLALDNALSSSGETTPLVIHNKYLKEGIRKLSSIEVQMENDYLSIIANNIQKEFILRFLAKQTSKRISDGDICNYCHKNGMKAPQPKNILKNLLAQREPQFIVREKEGCNYVLFLDSLFKTFINSRDAELLKEKDGKYILS